MNGLTVSALVSTPLFTWQITCHMAVGSLLQDTLPDKLTDKYNSPPADVIWSTTVGDSDRERTSMIGHYSIRHVHTVYVILAHLASVCTAVGSLAAHIKMCEHQYTQPSTKLIPYHKVPLSANNITHTQYF